MEDQHVAARLDALNRAIQAAGNSQASLAERIREYFEKAGNPRPRFGQQTVSYWVNEKTLIAAEYWPAIEAATGGAVTRADLRPDVFDTTILRKAVRHG